MEQERVNCNMAPFNSSLKDTCVAKGVAEMTEGLSIPH